jgi:hypothetical protein
MVSRVAIGVREFRCRKSSPLVKWDGHRQAIGAKKSRKGSIHSRLDASNVSARAPYPVEKARGKNLKYGDL